jgi:hypothetical protein
MEKLADTMQVKCAHGCGAVLARSQKRNHGMVWCLYLQFSAHLRVPS